MADIDQVLSKHSDTYRFHGVAGSTLSALLAQAEGTEITLWGRIEDEDGICGYERGSGELSTTCFKDIEMSYNEFCQSDGIVFVLEPRQSEVAEDTHDTDAREHLLKVEEWRVVGGLRPIFDEDGDLAGEEAFSLEEMFDL